MEYEIFRKKSEVNRSEYSWFWGINLGTNLLDYWIAQIINPFTIYLFMQ